jgi:hypothetical protein
MIDNIFDVVFKGKGSNFKISALRNSEHEKKKINFRVKKQFFSASKKSIEVYSDLLRVSLEALRKSTIKFLKGNFFKVVLYRVFQKFIFLKIKYLSFFKSFSDFILLRVLLCYLIEKYKNLNFLKKIKLYSFINFLIIKLLNFYNLLRNDFNILFFNLIKRSITLNYFNIFSYKISSKFKKKSRLFFNKKKITKIFKINNIFFDNIYLKTLLNLFNLKIKAFTYLLKQNHL